MAAGRRILPGLVEEEVTATYAGLRAATEHRDYQISVDGDRRYVSAGGIRSTGLTASLAIAEYVVEQMASGRCGPARGGSGADQSPACHRWVSGSSVRIRTTS